MNVPPQDQPWFFKLHWQVVIAMIAGSMLGLWGGPGLVRYYNWIGLWFVRILGVVVVPLVVSAIVVGVARLGNPELIRRLGLKTLLYYLSTAALAIVTALVMVNLIHPGEGVALDDFVQGGPWGYKTTVKEIVLEILPFVRTSGGKLGLTGEGNSTIFGAIFIAFAFGVGLASLKAKRRNVVMIVFDGLFEILMKIVDILVRLAPLAVLSLIASLLARTGSWIIIPLAGYMGTVAAGLGFHFFVTIPAIIFLFARRNPFVYFRMVQDAPATAFATASSNAALPVTMQVAEVNAGIDTRITGFVLPLGAMVNLDGAALYEGVAALFIAQAYGFEFGFSEQPLIMLTAVVTSIGAAGIPHASLVMLAIVFHAVGLPLEAIGILFAVDRILDMWRTATNVWSDLGAAAVVAASEPGGVVDAGTDREWTGEHDLKDR